MSQLILVCAERAFGILSVISLISFVVLESQVLRRTHTHATIIATANTGSGVAAVIVFPITSCAVQGIEIYCHNSLPLLSLLVCYSQAAVALREKKRRMDAITPSFAVVSFSILQSISCLAISSAYSEML